MRSEHTASLSIVVPCYNEEAVLETTAGELLKLVDVLIEAGKVSADSSITFVDDGSTDNTWSILERLTEDGGRITAIKLARNHGHQNALLAGILNAKGDAIISLDADLQDDLGAIPKMLEAYYDGKDIVYGVRNQRTTDSPFKKLSAEAYYRFLNLLGVNVVFNHADFRLLSRRVLDTLDKFEETNLFLRGLIPSIGFPSTTVSYERKQRRAGQTKYTFGKMMSLAWEGVTSFSSFPLRCISILGALVFLVSSGMAVWALGVKFFHDDVIPGWTSSVLPMYFLGGIQLLCLGVIGEYVGKIYMETKRRPRFIIEKIVN